MKQWDLDDLAMRHDYLKAQGSAVSRGERLEYQCVGSVLERDGSTILTCMKEGSPRLWDIKSGALQAQLPGEDVTPQIAAIDCNKQTLLALDVEKQSLYGWGLSDYKQIKLPDFLKLKVFYIHYEEIQNQFYVISKLSETTLQVHIVSVKNLTTIKRVTVKGSLKEIGVCVVTDNGNYMVLLCDPFMDPNGCIEYRGGHLQLNGNTEVDLIFMSTTMYCARSFEDDLVLIGVMGKS